MYTPLEWDTSFFGFSVARCDPSSVAQLEAGLAAAQRDAVTCMYVLVEAEDQTLVHRLMREPNASCVDLRLTLSMKPRDVLRAEEPPELAHEDDLEWLEPLAREAHVDARFFADWRFEEARARDLYATWIRRSVAGWAQRVFTVRRDGRALGYVTAHLDEGVGRIGLVAMSPAARGLGLGTRLLRQALCWFDEQGVERVEVVTQGRNVAAQRLYQHHGLRTTRAQLWYHVWW